MTSEIPRCARCSIAPAERMCQNPDGRAPSDCPTVHHDSTIRRALTETRNPDVLEFVRQASIQEGEGYGDKERGYEHVRPIKARIQETIEFARKMDYRRLGLVFCVGLRKEARVVERLLSDSSFEVASGLCKMGRVPKEEIGLRDEQKIRVGAFEPMCNPIAQAMVMNDAGTEFNIVMGLCVGHDSLFLKYAEAPCTVLAVKDRLLGHNPLAAVYTIDSYYRALK
jgi:uncharacterized metal-binding protein